MAAADIDRNLLFGVIALQDDIIDDKQFTDACIVWCHRLERPLADVLMERQLITAEDRREIERKIERKIRKHGNVRASLAAVAGADARDLIRSVDHPDVRNSLSSLPPAAGHVLLETVVPPHQPESSRYTLTRMHAEGGLGRVWLTHDRDLHRGVALKEIRPDRAPNPDMWRRFLKEAQITGQLEHPNIVPVYELARRREDDQPFYTMRFVRGQSLRGAIQEFHHQRAGKAPDRLALQSLLGALLKVCDAIAYAHSRGVVHRDLKPENVVLGGYGEVLVLDWGLAKLVDQPDERGEASTELDTRVSVGPEAIPEKTHGLVGTPCYMAPEQVEAKHQDIDERTDIYAAGGILFEILTGHSPAEGATTAEVLEKIRTARIPRARQIEPTVPRPLEAVCAKAMALDRSQRYTKAADLAADVRRWIADEPVAAFREPLPAHVRRWARKHRTLVASGAAVLVLGLVGSVGFAAVVTGKNRELARQTQRAEARERMAIDAVKRFRDVLVEEPVLKNNPALEELRKKLLKEPLAFFKSVREQLQGDNETRPEALARLAEAAHDYAHTTDEIGNIEDALRAHVDSLTIWEKLVRDHP
jgi:serine/threonine-protein kinase